MPRRVIVVLVGAVALAAMLAMSMSSRADAAREVTLDARGMAFYVNGSAAPNAPIQARPGELLRVTLRNRDAGLVHDFAVRDLGISMTPLQAGHVASVVFRVPRQEGTFEYVCQPHAQMMRGRLEVARH